MRFYDIVLFLFLFGAVCQTFNVIGGLGNVPAQNPVITQANVEEVTTGSTSISPFSFFWPYQILVAILSVIVMGALAVISIIPLVLLWTSALGINPVLVVAVMSPFQIGIWWVMINAYFQMTTGHPYKVMK